MTNQPEALRVADMLESAWRLNGLAYESYATRLLREQHAEIQRLRAECDRLRELAALYINEICRFDKERMS